MQSLLSLASLFLVGNTPAEEHFEKHVRGILVEHCYSCHGPKKQMSGLRVDSREGLLRGGDNGPALQPSKPDESAIITAVRHVGDLKMPPKKKLEQQQIDALSLWVKQGAPWPAEMKGSDAEAWKKHWAFQPFKRPSLPQIIHQPSSIINPIDLFIVSRLQAQGMTQSPEADRRTLVRRLSYDLLGLPPTPVEVDAARNDKQEDWYERLVERMLASPHYGERWGRHWLDVARYADTKGYVFFEEAAFPWAWTYRDYVIRSFNDDKPYNRFILEQLAADRLDDKNNLPALGFLALGGRFMNNVHDILDDRIDVVTRGLLGLTVTCARCHDHKFDPIPTKDYYSLYGVFSSSIEPPVPPEFLPPPKTPEYEKFVKELDAREKKLGDFLEGKRKALREGAKKRANEYLLAVHKLRDVPDTQEFMLIADGNDLNPTMISRWKAQIRRSLKTREPVFALWHLLSAIPEKDIEAFLKKKPAMAVNSLVWKALTDKPTKTMADVAQRYGELLNQPLPSGLEAEPIRQVLEGPDAAANVLPGQMSELELLPDRASQGELQKLRNAVQDWRVKGPGAPPRATILVDLEKPIQPRVFQRGNPGNLGEIVSRQFLEVLSGKDRKAFSDGSGRLELARAIIHRENPLTARVMVNRVWMHHFGRGLVTTPGDFGLRSDPPSHPELLDYLASRFADDYSLKNLHRLIVTSATYRQQNLDRPKERGLDPENVLLWRYPRRRLDFESLRDSLLATSGRLAPYIGGKSVTDYLAPAANRRSLYSHLDRLNMPILLRTFDLPSPDATSPQRVETTVPQQALFLMNSSFVQDCAKRLVKRPEVIAEKTIEGRAEKVYRLLFGRSPTAEELKLAKEYHGEESGLVTWERYVQALLLTNEFLFVD